MVALAALLLSVASLSVSTQSSPAGADGAAGAPGGFDPDKISYVLGPDVKVGATGSKNAYAYCPDGSVITGGGYSSLLAGIAFSASTPDRTGWHVIAFNQSGTPTTFNAFAVCVSP